MGRGTPQTPRRRHPGLSRAGFTVESEHGRWNLVLADRLGRQADVHAVDIRVVRTDERGIGVYGANGLAYPVGSPEGTGTVLGRTVARGTPEFQVGSHTGYDIDEDDVRDVLPPPAIRRPAPAALRAVAGHPCRFRRSIRRSARR
jgi:hypothetical protein